MNSCELVRATLLDSDWGEADLQRVLDAVEHLRGCP